MNHVHSSTCGCKEYTNVENAQDLYSVIELAGINCLNESQSGKGRCVFKEEDKKLENGDFVQSDEPDPEMIFIIPFTCTVNLKSINIIAKDQEHAPNILKVYTNQENVDFSISENKGLEEFMLIPNLDGTVYQSVRQSKFQNITKLILYVASQNTNKETIAISYIGLKGESTGLKRQIVNAVYEIKPLAEDNHPSKLLNAQMKENC
ncbi:hypothetical protein ABPG72_002871 [Tetrahymena utriculariae]